MALSSKGAIANLSALELELELPLALDSRSEKHIIVSAAAMLLNLLASILLFPFSDLGFILWRGLFR